MAGGLPLVAALASFAAGFPVLRLLRAWQVLDHPNARSSHVQPTPRGGGLGILLVIEAGLLSLALAGGGGPAWVLAAGAAALGGISFYDDRHPLSWRVRFGTQALAAAAVAAVLLPGAGLPILVVGPAVLFGMLLLAGYANAFNFMDGINGLAAGQAAVSGLGLAWLATVAGAAPTHPAVSAALVVAGAAAGFLPHNFPRARMFMGDVGSVPLGFLLMGLTLWLAHDLGWRWLPVLGAVHAGFILDTGVTLVRRALRREVLHQAHREHFYQRLVRAGWSHVQATTFELSLTATGVLVLAGFVFGAPQWTYAGVVAVGLIWGAGLALAETVFRRHASPK